MKLMIYPASEETMTFSRYSDMIIGYDEIVFVAPKGWANEQKLLVCKDGAGINVRVTTDFEKALECVDTVCFTEVKAVLSPKFLKHRIEMAINSGKKVFFDGLRSMVEHYKCANNVTILSGPKFEFEDDSKGLSPAIFEIPVPVVWVMGIGPNTNKFDIQLALRRKFEKEGYIVSQTGTNRKSVFFGFDSYPGFIFNNNLSIKEKIVCLNRYFYYKCLQEKPDLMIIGIPGGIMPLNPRLYEELGELAFLVSLAIRSDVAVLSAYIGGFTQQYFDEIKMLCKYKYHFDLKYMVISNTSLDFSSETHETQYVPVTFEIIQRAQAETYDGIRLFNILDEQDMARLGFEVIEELSRNL